MLDSLTHIEAFLKENLWVVQVFLVVFGVLVANFTLARFLDRLLKKLENTPSPWDDSLIRAVRQPGRVLIWVEGIAFAARIVGRHTGAPIFDIVSPVQVLSGVICTAWFLIGFVREAEANIIRSYAAKGEALDRTTADAISKLARVSIIITAVLVSMQSLGFNLTALLTMGGLGSIGVGLAAKDLLANFFGGLMIYLDRPFSVGDWIRSPDRNIEGTVEKIGWRLTMIRTFDKRPLYVPNAVFATISVENPSRMSHRRIKETIGIRYDDVAQMNAITTAVKQMLVDHPEIDETQTTMVHFDTFDASSLNFFVYCFTHTTVWTRFHEIKQDVLLRIAEIIDRHGAECAFPTRTLHMGEPLEFAGMEPFLSRAGGGEKLTQGGQSL